MISCQKPGLEVSNLATDYWPYPRYSNLLMHVFKMNLYNAKRKIVLHTARERLAHLASISSPQSTFKPAPFFDASGRNLPVSPLPNSLLPPTTTPTPHRHHHELSNRLNQFTTIMACTTATLSPNFLPSQLSAWTVIFHNPKLSTSCCLATFAISVLKVQRSLLLAPLRSRWPEAVGPSQRMGVLRLVVSVKERRDLRVSVARVVEKGVSPDLREG